MRTPIANASLKMRLLMEASAKLQLALELTPARGDLCIRNAIKSLLKAENWILQRPLPRSERSHD